MVYITRSISTFSASFLTCWTENCVGTSN